MEKFKNALKRVNKFGVLALMLVAFATLAFKAPNPKVKNSLLTEYGRLANGAWVEVNGATEGPNSGQFNCNIASNPCRALFEAQPDMNEQPEEGNIIQADGDYSLNP